MGDRMYNEDNHPLQGDFLRIARENLSPEDLAEFDRQDAEHKAAGDRDYFIVIREPTFGDMASGHADGTWMHIQNGIMMGSNFGK